MIDTIQTIMIIVTAAYLLYMKREQNMGTALILKLISDQKKITEEVNLMTTEVNTLLKEWVRK